MILPKPKIKKTVLLPEDMLTNGCSGKLYGKYFEQTGVFNIFDDAARSLPGAEYIGEIIPCRPYYNLQTGMPMSESDAKFHEIISNKELLVGVREDGKLAFMHGGENCEIKTYNLIQNVFSRNTGILETGVMSGKSAVIVGCGSVGSQIALELAKAGVGKFLLIDHDIFEYHNICRHQCSLFDVGDYKVNALERRIKAINPHADVSVVESMVQSVDKSAFEGYCLGEDTIIITGADDRAADVYVNSLAVTFGTAFISVGCWERAFAGEIFYWLPNANMPCYKCALGDGGGMSNKATANHHIYTNQENLETVNFMPGISVDIGFVNIIAAKLIIDILNRNTEGYVPKLLDDLEQFTLVCNTNKTEIGGEMAEIFSYPLQVTTSLEVGFGTGCPPCQFGR